VIDAPLPLIEIEAVVVEFATTKIRELGLDWNLKSIDWSEREGSLSIITPEMGDAVLALDFFRNMLKIGDKKVDLTASLKALSEAGVAKIRATPRIRTLHGHTALVGTIKEQYFFITSGETGEYFNYYSRLETIKSGIQLEITPYVDSLQYITVDVKPQVDDVVGQGTSGLPEISRRAARTTVRVKNGETFTIGGLRLSEKKSVNHRVPILGSIPILGALFGKTENEEVEKELVIFITPHVL
jgi:type II secretory pathway component GspD/PulD (secretin)